MIMFVSGRILRIEKLSSFDGEGLRTVVFLKGCSLRCQWCSTPESHASQTDFGNNKGKCVGCFKCVDICPEKAISFDIKKECFITDMEKCSDCRKCIDVCPEGSRIAWGYTASVDEIFKEIQKDSVFYYHSGGGVTISGGEPFLQKSFVSKLLEQCVLHGVNTAVETCGHALWENIKETLPFVDTLFYDLKHMDDGIHKKITGVGNSLIIENLKKIDAVQRNFPIIVRMPIIPGVNDSNDNINALGEFCKKLNNLKEIQFLSYHRLGIETYKKLSIPYALDGLEPPDKGLIEHKTALLKEMGLMVRIE
jgi:pyruvate formate lyase activating enzyme